MRKLVGIRLALAASALALSVATTEALPEHQDLSSTYQLFWKTVNDHYIGFRPHAWSIYAHQFDTQLGDATGEYLDQFRRSAIASLNDPKVRFVSLQEAESFIARQAGEAIGLGINIFPKPVARGYVVVTSVPAGPNGDDSRLYAGDHILKVDGVPVTGYTLQEIMKKIGWNGAQQRSNVEGAGNKVLLTIERGGQIQNLTVDRELEHMEIDLASEATSTAFVVDYVLQDGPAARAGFQLGDEITSVDDISTEVLSAKGVRFMLDHGGFVGTAAKVEVLRDRKPMEIDVVRWFIPEEDDLITLGAGADDDFALVCLRNLDWTDVATESAIFGEWFDKSQHGILDLRNSSGENPAVAAQIIASFAKKDGVVLQTEEMEDGRKSLVTYSLDKDEVIRSSPLGTIPIARVQYRYKGTLVVLVDGQTTGTAAAVAESLQHRGDARVIGYRTNSRDELIGYLNVGDESIAMPVARLMKVGRGSFTGVVPDRILSTDESAITAARQDLNGYRKSAIFGILVPKLVKDLEWVAAGLVWLLVPLGLLVLRSMRARARSGE